MKYLQTLKTSPHKYFGDISDDDLQNYAKENFDISLTSYEQVKDIINIYSHILFDESPRDAFFLSEDVYIINEYKLSLPADMDILNASFSVLLKLHARGHSAVPANTIFSPLSVEEQAFKENIIALDLFGATQKRERFRMETYSNIVSIPKHELFLESFPYKFAQKKFTIAAKHLSNTMFGYLYIDFSASVRKNNYTLFKLFKENLPFTEHADAKLVLYSVTTYGIKLLGTAGSFMEFTRLVDKTPFSAGTINVRSVIKHVNARNFRSTFITDAEDFNIKSFMQSTHNCNLIKIDGNGTVAFTE